MSATALGMGAWGAYDPSPVVRTRSRTGSFLGGPPRFADSYYPFIQQTVVVDGALGSAAAGGTAAGQAQEEGKMVRRRETIFGPDVGDDDQPGWVAPSEGNKVSVDTVKRWVDKAKTEEGLHATTTLQALVNLKRPTLLLHPLDAHAHPNATGVTAQSSSPRSSFQPPASPLHLLKFNYDAMTPQVHITLTLHPTPNSSGDEDVPQPEPKVLYEGSHPGGFNQAFTLPNFAAIDLSSAIAPLPAPESEPKSEDLQDGKGTEEDSAQARAQSEDTSRSSFDRRSNAAPASTELAVIPEFTSPPVTEEPRRRFGLFGRRHRETDVESQIEMQPTTPLPETPSQEGTVEPKPEEKPEPEHGMRLLISIEGVGADGPLRRRNAQLTHILVSGTWAPDAGSNPTSVHNSSHGKRVWVVKVVRREAQIGAHSFLLKEIYGLSSSSNSDESNANSNDPYASTPNECIVCLTSPRDVVLLPCRHLVVCRECAVGMVEFGAGGRVARREETETTEAPAEGTDATVAGGATPAVPTPAPAPAPTPRRKKKAKGWYCPVCRQPYTSLLRLALAPSKPELPLSRAASIRSVRTTKSLAPTLPDGAEAMLSNLVPQLPDDADDDDDDHDHDHDHDHLHSQEWHECSNNSRRSSVERQRPGFVVAEQTVYPPPAAVVAGSIPAQRATTTAVANDPAAVVAPTPVPPAAIGATDRKPDGTV